MSAASAHAARLKTIAVLTALLFVLGAGGAAAYWTASDELDGSVSSASVGITQTDPLDLQTEYHGGKLVAVDTVTIRNTGDREAALAVTAGAAFGPSLSAALGFTLAFVANAEECTPNVVLESSVRGGVGLVIEGRLAADETATLCVRTELPARGVFVHAGKRTALIVTSTLTYAAGADWTVSSSGETGEPIQQSVTADPTKGVVQMSCSDGVLPVDYFATFTLSGNHWAAGAQYRAYLVQGTTIRDIREGAFSFPKSGPSGNATINERDLRAAADWRSGEAWLVIEQKMSGGQWTMAAMSKLQFRDPLLNLVSTDVSC